MPFFITLFCQEASLRAKSAHFVGHLPSGSARRSHTRVGRAVHTLPGAPITAPAHTHYRRQCYSHGQMSSTRTRAHTGLQRWSPGSSKPRAARSSSARGWRWDARIVSIPFSLKTPIIVPSLWLHDDGILDGSREFFNRLGTKSDADEKIIVAFLLINIHREQPLTRDSIAC